MTRQMHVDMADDRQRHGAAHLLGVKVHTLTLWLMQNGGTLDYERLPTAWVEHAVGVLETVQGEHGTMAMADVLDMLADQPSAATPRRRRRSRR